MTKKYEELEFTDRFMFAKILYSNPELCRELLELILDKKITMIIPIQYEKDVEISYGSKGVRFDVYTEDDENNSYDIEMQVEVDGTMTLRARYYQAMIDLNRLEKGADYSELKKSYVIFICKNNPGFSVDAPIYRAKMVVENVPGVEYDDGRYLVFVNAQYSGEDVSDEMKEFLHFIRTGQVDSSDDGSLVSKLHEATVVAREHKEWRTDYMTLEMLLKEEAKKIEKKTREEVTKSTRKESLEALSMALEKHGIPKEQVMETYKENLELLHSENR